MSAIQTVSAHSTEAIEALVDAASAFAVAATAEAEWSLGADDAESVVGFLDCDLRDAKNDAFERELESRDRVVRTMGFTADLPISPTDGLDEGDLGTRRAFLNLERAKADATRKRIRATSSRDELESAQRHLLGAAREMTTS